MRGLGDARRRPFGGMTPHVTLDVMLMDGPVVDVKLHVTVPMQ
jgi:hypothetical protein